MINRFLLMAMAFVSYGVIAQTNFPYSHSGIGERVNSNHPVFSGMGNNFVSYTHPSILNTNNAATYSFLRHQFPIFSLGLSTRLSFNESAGEKETNTSTNFTEIAFGLSFAKRFGLAFGIKPVHKKSYSFTEKRELMGDSLRYDYIGNGTLNKAFVGFSARILNFDSLKWSVGGNIGSIFGGMQDERRSALIQPLSNGGGVETRLQQIRSFHYDIGTYLQWQLKNGHKLTFGGTFEPVQNIRSVYSRQLSISGTDVSNPNTYVVLKETGEQKGKIAFASNYTVGVSYLKVLKVGKRDGSVRNSQLMVSASYSATDWSKYREKYSDTTFSYDLKNSSGLQIGLEYIPEIQYIGNAMPKFFERSSYRLGFYSNMLPYVFNNTQLTEWGATIGFGFPMIVDKRLDSSLQFGFGAGQRGTSEPGSFNETFVTFNIGVLIAPGINDRWFVKRKLD
jgi:hypothetical protein